jgi:NTE family protein
VRWKSAATLLATTLLLSAAVAQEHVNPPAGASSGSALPAVQPPGRASIGVALQGGSALGLAHIGVFQWFEEHHIPVDRLSGTSMGSLIGALYATGVTPAQMRSLAASDAFTRVFALQTPYYELSFRRRQDRRELPAALAVGLKHGLSMRNALLTDHGVNEFLTSNLPGYNSQELDYDRLPIPFRCVATDLTTLESVTFAGGPLPQAVRASISLPGVFSPVQDRNGHYLVDGGILDNLPTDVLKRDLHADIVIAIRLEDAAISKADTSSVVGILNRAFDAGIQRNVARAALLADVVVSVPVGRFSGNDYARAPLLIEAGYKAAEQKREALERYALDDEGWKAYLADRESRRAPLPGQLRQVRVEGGAPGAVSMVAASLKRIEGQPITPGTTQDALRPIQSNGGISAIWETFAPRPETLASRPASESSVPPATPALASNPPVADTGLLVRLTSDPTGPPFLLISPELAAATSNISRGEVNLRFVDQNFGGFGSELRGNARIGYMTDLNAEYYRLLTPSGYFLEPRARILRQPVYIWANQKRIAERFQENLEAGIEAGRTFSNQLQIAAEWRAEDTRWSPRTGTGGGSYISGTAQSGLLHIGIDRTSSAAISPKGFRLTASAGALYHAVASDNAPMARLSFGITRSKRDSNILALGGEINSYLRANVAEPFRFTLGGPMRLSASSFDEFRGTDTYLARAGYLHRIAALPTGLGHGLYGVLGYEAGEVWSPEARATLRQDGLTGLVANTPIGLLTFGISVGDAGHRKVFVTLGRWF